MSTESSVSGIELEIKNVGGIEHREISIDPGLTVLSGENATNRTSLLKAIMALAGSDKPPIRSGTEQGHVKGKINGEVYKREVRATSNGYTWSGDGYCDDPLLAELYSFLLEHNEVRQTVSSGGDLRKLIMRPVDIDEIEAREKELRNRKRELQSQKDDIDEAKARIDNLKKTISSKRDEKAELLDKKANIESQIDDFDGDISQQESKFDEASAIQDDIAEVGRKISNLESDIDRKESSLKNRKEELSQLNTGGEGKISDINARIKEINQEIEAKKNRQEQITEKQETIRPLRTFLSQVVNDGDAGEINDAIADHTDLSRQGGSVSENAVTDGLISDQSDSDICILCGSELDPGHYENIDSKAGEAFMQLNQEDDKISDQIKELINEKKSLKSERRDIRNDQDREEVLIDEIESHQQEIESKKSKIEDLESQKAELDEEHEDVKQGLEDNVQKLIGLNSDLNETVNKIQSVESTIENRKSDLASAEDSLQALESSEDELEQVQEELQEVRNKVSEIEKSAIDEFNGRMDEVLDRLGYTGIERVWVQAREVEKRKGRRKVMETVFDLNIVREIDGKTTEDTIENLSESEREVTGLIFALTGFLVHDVGTIFPVTLMDSIEMVDSARIEELLRYYGQYTEYLIVAALPADADQIDVGEGAIVEMAN